MYSLLLTSGSSFVLFTQTGLIFCGAGSPDLWFNRSGSLWYLQARDTCIPRFALIKCAKILPMVNWILYASRLSFTVFHVQTKCSESSFNAQIFSRTQLRFTALLYLWYQLKCQMSFMAFSSSAANTWIIILRELPDVEKYFAQFYEACTGKSFWVSYSW